MHDSKVGDQRVVHVLPEEGIGVEGVEGDSVGPAVGIAMSAVAMKEDVCRTELGDFTALADQAVTFWVLSHRYEERVKDMFRRLSF